MCVCVCSCFQQAEEQQEIKRLRASLQFKAGAIKIAKPFELKANVKELCVPETPNLSTSKRAKSRVE